MKNIVTFFTFFLMSIALIAQTPCTDCPPASGTLSGDSASNFLVSAAQMDFVPGQILVRFKDDVTPVLRKSNGYVALGVPTLDAILQKYKVTSAEKVFPNEQRKMSRQTVKTFSGQELEVPSLHNIHKLETDSMVNIFEAIEALKQNENVVYAEPNYMYSIGESEALSPALTEEEMLEWLKENPIELVNQPARVTNVTPNDPLYAQQWALPASQVDAVWDSTTGDTTQIIAILDTGVDWLHPDLKNKIWHNPGEIPDNGWDDDGNGKVDDVVGWDFVNYDNNPLDDNGHGTHVAGIAAAEANNGLGIAGVSWGAKLLPIKVMTNKGSGDASKISQGVNYAASVGATVINMSLGGYFKSLTLETALINALIGAEVIAAAGNDKLSIYDQHKSSLVPTPFYPAAYHFVLGVEDFSNPMFLFSNFDPDGPVYSEFPTGENYELLSYGLAILSSFPGGQYKVFTGTSMAAPLISGIIALYNSAKMQVTREERWGDFINASRPTDAFTNIFSTEKQPAFDLRSFELTDTLPGNDYDNQADAGETIHIWARIRNTYGNSDSTYIKLQLSDLSRPYYSEHIDFIKNVSFLGSISTYRERHNQYDPFIIYLKPNFPNEKRFELEVLMWNAGSPDTNKQTINITVYNGTELTGFLTGNIVLTPDRLWLINNSTRLTTGSTMKIMPGTHLIINGSFDNRGYIEGFGTKDSIILFEGPGTAGNAQYKYVNFDLRGGSIDANYLENCSINNGYRASGTFEFCEFNNMTDIVARNLKNCKINGLKHNEFGPHIQDTLMNCVIANSALIGDGQLAQIDLIQNNIFINNYFINAAQFTGIGNGPVVKNNIFRGIKNFIVYLYPGWPGAWQESQLFELNPTTNQKYFGNAFIMNRGEKFYNILKTAGGDDSVSLSGHYFGTSDINKINKWIIDFQDNALLPYASLNPMMIPPSESLHGFVWKVLVNGKDAQDEYVDPLGVGPHRFDVYFNRPMDPNFTPNLTFGGIFPYTTHSIIDSSHWSPDKKKWTAYHTVKLYTGDGINRIRVAGARDPEGFEIPFEDQRFEFLIDAAGSASADFQATAGLGKVNLEWSNPSSEDVPDLLGYNMYRLEHITDTTLTDPVMINSSLIADTLFTDFNVVPNKKYYYYYRVVRTDFSESDSSKVISSIPFTAAVGDANGDLTVNILDITSIVGYLLNQNPQPFIIEAADVNHDDQINILDVVGVVNQIMGGMPKFAVSTNKPTVSFDSKAAYIENGSGLTAMQFKLAGKDIAKAGLVMGPAAKGMEMSYSVVADTMYVVLYNFKNNGIVSDERGMLFTLTDGYFKELKELIGSDAKGEPVEISVTNDGEIIPKEYLLYQNYPNPFNPNTTIRYALPNPGDVELIVYNILGQKVWDHRVTGQKPGYYEIVWNGKNNYGSPVASGVYIYQLRSGKFFTQKKMSLLK